MIYFIHHGANYTAYAFDENGGCEFQCGYIDFPNGVIINTTLENNINIQIQKSGKWLVNIPMSVKHGHFELTDKIEEIIREVL